MYKIRNGARVRLDNDPVTGELRVTCESFYPPFWWTGAGYIGVVPRLGFSFYPLGSKDPFGGYGTIPGTTPRKRRRSGPSRMDNK